MINTIGAQQDKCPSCSGEFYHYAGCAKKDHGVVITANDRRKWFVDRMDRMQRQHPNYNYQIAAEVVGNQV